MPTLPNMGLITPTLGSDSGTWDDKINAALALVDAHDHTSGKGVAITVAAMSIDDDLAFGGNGITGIGRVDFSAVSTLAAGANVLFVDSGDGELYWRTTGGTNVKLTDGASINTTLVGGIVGDYSSVGAELAYDDANKTYTFKTEDAKWARLGSGPVRIYEYNTTESVYVEHAVDAALAAPYTITWPAALPASTSPVYISAAGVVTFGVTSDDVLALPGCAWETTTGSYNFTYGSAVATVAGTTHFYLAIPLKTGDRIKSITIAVKGNVSADADISVFDATLVTAAAGTTSLGTTSSANVSNAWQDITIDLTDTTLAAGEAVTAHLQISGAGATAMEIGNTRITYTPVH